MIAAVTPMRFRHGLADMMAATEERRSAYDALLGTMPEDYDRARDLPIIFGREPIAYLDRVRPGFELVACELIRRALLNARRKALRELRPGFEDLVVLINVALQGERRIRAELLAQERFING